MVENFFFSFAGREVFGQLMVCFAYWEFFGSLVVLNAQWEAIEETD